MWSGLKCTPPSLSLLPRWTLPSRPPPLGSGRPTLADIHDDKWQPLRTELQVKPHEGFAQGYIGHRDAHGVFDNEGKPRTLQLAVPPAWMTDQELPCHGRISDYFDTRGKSSAQLASLCAGCPVVEQCLQFALDMEGNAAANLRYGVYG